MDKLKIGITHGDTNGVSYEVILKSFEDPTMLELCTPIVYGSSKMAAYHRKSLELTTNYRAIPRADEAMHDKLNLVECIHEEVKIDLGQETPESILYARKSLDAGIADLAKEKIDVLVVNPLNPEKSLGTNSQVEYILSKMGQKGTPLIILSNENLRIALATNNLPISEVASKITKELILERIRQLDFSLKRDFRFTQPRIAVLALNPHPSEEEENAIKPALEDANTERINAYGPFNADEFFGECSYRHYDAVLAMYDEQGKTPFKVVSKDEGVIYVSNLPYICTCPSQNTQYSIAGKGVAEAISLNHAIFSAIDIHRNRAFYDKSHEDPLPKLYQDKRDDPKKSNFNVE